LGCKPSGAEVLRGAGALAREHSGKGTTSVLEPALSEAEGAEQLPFLIVIPSGFSREQSAVDNPVRTCGADPSCPRDSVPDNVRRERPRSCWHRLREDSLVRHPFAFCAKGGSHPMWRGHSCPRDPIPDDVGASVLARAPLTIVILEEAESCARAGLPTKDLRISGLPRMLRRNLVQSKPGTARLLVLEPALSEAEGCRTASLSHRHSEWLQPRGICC